MMDPITNYEFGKARHRELEAEFGQHRSEPVINNTDTQSLPTKQRLILGLGSIMLGVLMITQTFAG